MKWVLEREGFIWSHTEEGKLSLPVLRVIGAWLVDTPQITFLCVRHTLVKTIETTLSADRSFEDEWKPFTRVPIRPFRGERYTKLVFAPRRLTMVLGKWSRKSLPQNPTCFSYKWVGQSSLFIVYTICVISLSNERGHAAIGETRARMVGNGLTEHP